MSLEAVLGDGSALCVAKVNEADVAEAKNGKKKKGKNDDTKERRTHKKKDERVAAQGRRSNRATKDT